MKQRTLTVPVNLVQKVVQHQQLLKAVTFYFDLRELTGNTPIKLNKQLVNQLCEYGKHCRRTVYNRVNLLDELGLTERHDSVNKLLTKSQLNSILDIKNRRNQVEICFTSDIESELAFRAVAIRLSLDAQREYLRSLLSEYIDGSVDDSVLDKALLILRKGLIEDFNNGIEPDPEGKRINPNITVSQEGIARLYNLRSRSSGHYWSKKLEATGLIQVERKQSVFTVCKVEQSNLGRVIELPDSGQSMLVLPNQISAKI